MGFKNKVADLEVGQEVRYRNSPMDHSVPLGCGAVKVVSIMNFRSQTTGNQCVTVEGDCIVRDANEFELVQLHQPTPWAVTFREKFPFGYEIHDATGELVMSAHAVCHSSKQKTIEDNRRGVGFKGEGEWSSGFAVEAVAQQEATARYIVATANACKGNSTAWLEGYGQCLHAAENAKPFRENIDAITTHRDELLAALKSIADFIKSSPHDMGLQDHALYELNRLGVQS